MKNLTIFSFLSLITDKLTFLKTFLPRIWRWFRQISGDDAYERYLIHWQQHHATEAAQPLDRRAFFKARMARKWSGVKRCC